MSANPPLRFGIPSLDQLFSAASIPAAEWGIKVPHDGSRAGVTSLCITGPSGTGKSVLAMHLAARYYTDCAGLHPWAENKRPTVIHVSTDLSAAQAQGIWSGFALEFPNRRNAPFACERVPSIGGNHEGEITNLHLKLTSCCFTSAKDFEHLARMMEKPRTEPGSPRPVGEVIFLNLAESTAGDDWNFVIKLISLLRIPQESSPHHLLIIDAVEGMELTVGLRDAHGEERTRRSRVAQLLRHAANKCHLVLVREEKDPRAEMPEEFVTDAVLRLRSENDGQYLRRTLEVVKSRGQASVRGAHHYLIRGKNQEATRRANPDDPWVAHPESTSEKPRSQSYIHVCPSLHCLTRMAFMGTTNHVDGPAPDSGADGEPAGAPVGDHASPQVAVGGTPPAILAAAGTGDHPPRYASFLHPRLPGILPCNGLPLGRVTVLTGDEATTKGRLARGFLAGAFQKPDELLQKDENGVVIGTGTIGGGVAVLITSGNLPKTEIERRLERNGGQQSEIKGKFIHRQLEVHDISSAVLLHIIRRCVDRGLEAAGVKLEARENHRWAARRSEAAKVRVVIEDWSVLQTMYPAVANDPLFLPFLIRYLEDLGVTTLIVETQPGRPGDVFRSEAPRHLRSLVAHHLFTWHVPFYGEDRVAITAVPPLRDDFGSPVIELRPPHSAEVSEEDRKQGALDERLCGDPHFELYHGLETGTPAPVPLTVQLFAAAEDFGGYAKFANGILNRVFAPTRVGGEVVVPLEPADYSSMREFSFLHSGARAHHTTVFTVDEYWPANEPAAHNAQDPYLGQVTWERDAVRSANDPYRSFQPDADPKKPWHKHSSFPLKHVYGQDDGFKEGKDWAGDPDWYRHYDRSGLVPYAWDFGFVMLDEDAWQAARKSPLRGQGDSVEKAWNYCTGAQKAAPLSWRDFLHACALVARTHAGSTESPLGIFGPETLTAQTFACLVLEMWFSEIGADKLTGPNLPLSETRLPGKRPVEKRNLKELLTEFHHEFFRVWLLLGEVVAPHQILDASNPFRGEKSARRVAAERHWYSTASRRSPLGTDAPKTRPGRLPGSYVTRGDWFLAIGRESRSLRLGERAIDFLSRRRANLARLEHGVGLPVRDILFEHERIHNDEAKKQARYEEIPTALHSVGDDGKVRPMNYHEVRGLGVDYPWSKGADQRHWLWRSQLVDYHRHDRIFERWIARLLLKADGWCRDLHLANSSGFAAYDAEKNKPGTDSHFGEFTKIIEVVREDFEKLATTRASHPTV